MQRRVAEIAALEDLGQDVAQFLADPELALRWRAALAPLCVFSGCHLSKNPSRRRRPPIAAVQA
jgi:HEAT repeat protein